MRLTPIARYGQGRANPMDVDVQACCPECGEAARNRPPVNWIVPGEVPGWTHVSDGTALCPVVTDGGYRPAQPVSFVNDENVVLIFRGREGQR
jgi:hypothetical protein